MNGKLASLAVQNSTEMGWFVVNTNPRCEVKVARALDERQYEYWLPTETRRHRRRYTNIYREITHPLLTGYLFIRLPKVEAHIGRLREIDGVRDVLGKNRETGRIVVGISDKELAAVRSLCDSGMLSPPADRRPYKVGQYVRVVAGPFAGLNVKVEGYSARESLQVLVKILGRLTPVDIGIDGVEAV